MARFASQTTVSTDKSRAEIERLLNRYGADSFGYFWERQGLVAVIQFRVHERIVRFSLAMPDPKEKRFTHHVRKGSSYARTRATSQVIAAVEQERRRVWRSLALVVKAKLEAVEAGIATFEQEFLAHIMLPNGQTVGDWASPQLEAIYTTQRMPMLLGEGS